MPPLMKYSNGVGHLIMSMLTTVTGLILIFLSKDAAIQGVGVAFLLTVQGYWYVSGSAKQIAHEITNQLKEGTGQLVTTTTTTETKSHE